MGGADEGEHEAGPAQGDDPQAGGQGRRPWSCLPYAGCAPCMYVRLWEQFEESQLLVCLLMKKSATLPQYYSCW